MPYLGEIAALSAAFFWSLASVFFNRIGKSISAGLMNLLKGVLAIGFIAIFMTLVGEKFNNIAPLAFILLAISGFLGITVGDTAFFHALKHLGPRRALLIGILNPPLSALLAAIFLQEKLPVTAFIGMAVTIAGVAWVIAQREPAATPQGSVALGVAAGLFATLTQSVGSILTRAAYLQTTVTALQSALIRLGAAVVFLIIFVLFSKGDAEQWSQVRRQPVFWRNMAIATLLGTFFSLWLYQVALQNAPIGIAQTLLSTGPLFILPIAAVMGEKITPKSVLGVLVSLFGIVLLFWL